MQRLPGHETEASSVSPSQDAQIDAQFRPRPYDGVNSAPPAGSSVPRIRRRNRMITSCLECRRRKLKCDKSHPCANCTKSTRDCIFLAPALDTASQLRLTEIKERMGSWERVLEQDVARNARLRNTTSSSLPQGQEIDFAPEPEDERGLEPSPMAVSDAAYEDDGDDLLDLGIRLGKLRLTDRIGGFFRPKMKEEFHNSLKLGRRDQSSAMGELPPPGATGKRQIDDYFAPGPTFIPPTSSFFFSTGNSSQSLIDFLPSMNAADHLLSQYWSCVHPIARVVHRPSFERRYALFWQEVQLGIEPMGSLQAVVFGALFSGIVSMPEATVLNDFGTPKSILMSQFQQGLETAIGRANLLRTTKVETMQAFVMYLICCCRAELSRSHSALVGTGIRLAECMGLHRDGSNYGMGPVETHVRRLVWYQLCFLDIRTCEAQGPRPGIRSEDFDTKFPLNVNDEDLERRNPPTESSKHWTDMTFTLIRFECVEMHRQNWLDRRALESKAISLTTVLGKVENFKRIASEKYLPMLDDSIPIHKAARLVLSILVTRGFIMVLHRYHNGVSIQIPDRLRQIILTSGTEQLESAVAFDIIPAVQSWAWYAGALHQYHVASLLLVEVFAYPQRKEANRIWACLDYVFESPAHLDRDSKARLILRELSERIGAYRDARKPRTAVSITAKGFPGLGTPQGSNQSSSASPPAIDGIITTDSPTNSTSAPTSLSSSQYQSQPRDEGSGNAHSFSTDAVIAPGSRFDRQHVQFQQSSVSPPEVPWELQPQDGAQAMPEPMPQLPSPEVDLNMDIDWAEWDKLFPPEINTGDLDLPPSLQDSGDASASSHSHSHSSSGHQNSAAELDALSEGFPGPAMFVGAPWGMVPAWR